MRKFSGIFLIIISTTFCIGQTVDSTFMDNFKISKWKSLENFNDSTILNLKEIKLDRWNATSSTPRNQPTFWISKDKFKIKFYYTTRVKTRTKVLNCTYSYNYNNGELTIIFDNKEKSTLIFKTPTNLTGSYILLTRKK